MSQGLHLGQHLTQSLVLSPQLQQSLALLQAPVLELKAMVEQELQQNPVLEELAAIESAMAEIMTQVLNGLADGSLSRGGLDAFRLAYDHARAALAEAKGRF